MDVSLIPNMKQIQTTRSSAFKGRGVNSAQGDFRLAPCVTGVTGQTGCYLTCGNIRPPCSVSPFTRIFTYERRQNNFKHQKYFPNKWVWFESLLHAEHSTIGTVWFKTIRLLLIHNKTNAKEGGGGGMSTQTKNRRIKAVFLRNVWELPHDGSVSDRTPQACHLFATSLRKQLKPTMRCGGGSVVGLVIQLMWWRVRELRGDGWGGEGWQGLVSELSICRIIGYFIIFISLYINQMSIV